MNQYRFGLLLAIPLLLSTCAAPRPQPVSPAFYCWQTSLALPPAQRIYLSQTGCKKLYVKIADIGIEPGSGEIIPYSQLQIADTTGLAGFDIVRVVFLTNAVFQQITPEKIEWLAGKIAEWQTLLVFPESANGRKELQIDCDWTQSSREAFFLFLGSLRQKLPPTSCLSATIRLHQYKFPARTGVPPVDRGMLMCYNTGDIDDVGAINSIFNLEDARKYIHGAPKDYPLPLDLALPTFSWILVYRDDELWKIILGAHTELPSGLLEKGTFIAGHYLRPGDIIRRETISADLLKNAARLTASTDLADDATLAFFHLDAATLRDYPVQLIDSVCNIANSIRAKK